MIIDDIYDVVKFNQIKERVKSGFLHFESKSDRIEFQILNMSQYFGHNFQLKYLIKGFQQHWKANSKLYKS